MLLIEEWANFLLRWVHVIAGIGWIGSSFYFIHLDLSLRKREGLPEGVGGEAWQVHGGGFYHMQKYVVAPKSMPKELTWFYWEAYATFLTGFALLVAHYYMNAEIYLVDKTVLDISGGTAIALSIAGLVVGYAVYEGLCRSPLGKNDLALGLVGFAFLVFLAWFFTKIFSGRGAFIELGALIGTAMVANVAHVIIPNQRKIVKALLAGETPDPALGKAGKQRSVHNNYLTLPVIFLMVSNHYPLAFASKYNWIIATLVLVIGVLIRHFYNEGHAGRAKPWWTWAVSALLVAIIMWLSMAGSAVSNAAAPRNVQFAQVQDIVTARCSMCHAREPVWDGIAAPPKGVMLDTPEAIRQHAKGIFLQAVATRAMPPGGNMTDLPDEDRQVLAAWFANGAPGI
jgi:uncharacterized membrane protein